MSIDTTPGSDSYRVAIKGVAIKGSASFEPASLTFDPPGKAVTGLASVSRSADNVRIIWIQGLPSTLLDGLSAASSMTIAAKKVVGSTGTITGAANAVTALRRCEADQLIEWGADPAQFAAGGRAPVALQPRDTWIANSGLLTLAAQSRRPAIADDFRLLVATDGSITECHATSKQTEPELEKMTCAAVLGRRLFNPSTSASGTGVRGIATFRINLMRRVVLESTPVGRP